MSYLTDNEKRMEFNMRKAQYFLGMQCSLNKGDGKELKELLNELIDDALQEGRKQGAVEELENILNWLELCSKGKNRVNTLPLIKIGLCKDVIDKRLLELKGEQK